MLGFKCLYSTKQQSHYYHNIFHHINSLLADPDMDVVILGNFNAPDINWCTFNAYSYYTQCLCSCLIDNNLA